MTARDEEARRAARRFKTAMDLYELAESMLRQKLRREHPECDEATIDAMVVAWRLRRPGAELGDSVGSPVPWPRSEG